MYCGQCDRTILAADDIKPQTDHLHRMIVERDHEIFVLKDKLKEAFDLLVAHEVGVRAADLGKDKPRLERMVRERAHLDALITKLREFIGDGGEWSRLSPVEQDLMTRQIRHMDKYSELLGRRIALCAGGDG